jgi:DNA-binding transcriptional ArsR family regulator
VPDPLSQFFSALADPSRRHLLGYLADHGTATATEMTGELPMTRQAVSKHLSALSSAGLVQAERAGRETRYRLTETGQDWDNRLDALRQHLQRHNHA